MEKCIFPVSLSKFNSQYFSNHSGIFAAVPVLVAYLLFQRQFSEGIALSGIKEYAVVSVLHKDKVSVFAFPGI